MDHSTFLILKPEALEAKLQEKILDMFPEHIISVLKKKTVTVNETTILAHYAEVIELATRHHDIVPKVREIVGATD